MRSFKNAASVGASLICLLLGSATPSLALNPQPEPPGRAALRTNQAANVKVDKAQPGDSTLKKQLPPGSCKQGKKTAC